MIKYLIFSILILVPFLSNADEKIGVICYLEQDGDFFKGRSFVDLGLSKEEGIIAASGQYTNALAAALKSIINDKPQGTQIRFERFSWVSGSISFITSQEGFDWLKINKNMFSCHEDEIEIVRK